MLQRSRACLELLLVVFLASFLACGGGSPQNVTPKLDPKALKQIVVNPPNPSLLKGNVLQMTATGIANDGTKSDITNTVAWNGKDTSSSSSSIADRGDAS